MSAPAKTHITYLDSIRGLAAFTVINDHFVTAYDLPCEDSVCKHLLDYSPLHIWWDGSAAVSMFFVLSGLVLSLKYFRVGHQADLNSFKLMPYMTSRLFRIWLPYVLILLMSAGFYYYTINSPLLKTALPPSEWIVNMWRNHPLTPTAMLRESFLLSLPAMVVLLPQAWTLTIELVLSLLLPIGLLLARQGSLWLGVFSIIAVFLLDVSPFLLHFALGLLIARYYNDIANYLMPRPGLRRFILIVGLLFYTAISTTNHLFSETFMWLVTGSGAGLIIIYTLSSHRTQALLEQPILRQLGKVSYSAYLIHMLILLCLTPYLLTQLELISANHLWLWLSAWLLTVISVQLLSLLSYYYIEIPSITLGRKLINGLQKAGNSIK
ncbi:MAG: acyltransferase [Methylococcales bacterium]